MTDKQLSPAERLRACLTLIYGATIAEEVYPLFAMRLTPLADAPRSMDDYFSERTVTLVTYGDSLSRQGEAPLATLGDFLRERLSGIIDSVHLLPFYPYSSDDGFSVTDYYAVDPALGEWADVQRLSADFRLMFDAVINHTSAKSRWFKEFLAGNEAFARLFLTASAQADLRGVVRPRTSPLLTPFTRASGETIHAWTTFSADQVDLDYGDPGTLLRVLDLLLFYVRQGAGVLRLDAIAYLWKEAGTTCIHLPRTHAVIQLFRAVLNAAAPGIVIITETNVPHAENVSYFGGGYDEAQLVYNFTLPPLLLHTLATGHAGKLRDWINTLRTPSSQTAFFNFTASHDGIGLRPVEDILSRSEVNVLVALIEARGGRISFKRNADGTDSPYELNSTYVDAAADPSLPVALQERRFLLSQAVMLALAGVPAIYIHSLLGSRNDVDAVARSGINRRINRAKLDANAVGHELDTRGSFRRQVFTGYARMLRARRASAAFHPRAPQRAGLLNDGSVLALARIAPDQSTSVLALFNFSAMAQSVDLTAARQAVGYAMPGFASAGLGRDLLAAPPGKHEAVRETLVVPPWETAWLELPRER